MTEIELRRKQGPSLFALVDDADVPLVSAHRWHALVSPYTVYAMRHVHRAAGVRTKQYLHTFLTGWSYVDHVDHNGLNNQRFNLRESSAHTNQANARSRTGSSQFKGVFWNSRDGRWQASVKVNRVNRYLGSFVSEEDAARAYDGAALEAFGEFALLNFPALGALT